MIDEFEMPQILPSSNICRQIDRSDSDLSPIIEWQLCDANTHDSMCLHRLNYNSIKHLKLFLWTIMSWTINRQYSLSYSRTYAFISQGVHNAFSYAIFAIKLCLHQLLNKEINEFCNSFLRQQIFTFIYLSSSYPARAIMSTFNLFRHNRSEKRAKTNEISW